MIKTEDRKVSDKFMDTMVSNFREGNKKLAYALGRMVELSRAGRANNCGFADLPLGKIENIRGVVLDESKTYDAKTGTYTVNPDYTEVVKTMDNIIYHNNPF